MRQRESQVLHRARQCRFDVDSHFVGENLNRTGFQTVHNALGDLAGVVLGNGIAETMSVSMKPACTPTTWVFCGASSTRNELVTDQIAALDAP